MTSRFPCPYLNGEVELTEEREHHIAERHPDLLPEYREQIVGTREEGQIRGGRGGQRLGRDESPLDHHGLFDDQAGRRKSRMETKLTFSMTERRISSTSTSAPLCRTGIGGIARRNHRPAQS